MHSNTPSSMSYNFRIHSKNLRQFPIDMTVLIRDSVRENFQSQESSLVLGATKKSEAFFVIGKFWEKLF